MTFPDWVKITTDGRGFATIANGESGEPIAGVKDITIVMRPGEPTVAHMDILTAFEGSAMARFTPVFDAVARCETCRWWTASEPDEYGGCAAPSDLLVLCRDLVTRADFGCVQWMPKTRTIAT